MPLILHYSVKGRTFLTKNKCLWSHLFFCPLYLTGITAWSAVKRAVLTSLYIQQACRHISVCTATLKLHFVVVRQIFANDEVQLSAFCGAFRSAPSDISNSSQQLKWTQSCKTEHCFDWILSVHQIIIKMCFSIYSVLITQKDLPSEFHSCTSDPVDHKKACRYSRRLGFSLLSFNVPSKSALFTHTDSHFTCSFISRSLDCLCLFLTGLYRPLLVSRCHHALRTRVTCFDLSQPVGGAPWTGGKHGRNVMSYEL